MMYSGDEEYGDDITSGCDKPEKEPYELGDDDNNPEEDDDFEIAGYPFPAEAPRE